MYDSYSRYVLERYVEVIIAELSAISKNSGGSGVGPARVFINISVLSVVI